MPRLSLLLSWLLLAVPLGCSRSAAPTAPAATPGEIVLTDIQPTPTLPAVFDLTIDPSVPTATASPLTPRTSAGHQASRFDLDLARFQTAAQFTVESVKRTDAGDVELTFTHAHPFATPDLAQPATALNRADLGYTGRLLILTDLQPADVPSHTFFGDVLANTEVITDADGYVRPGAVLAAAGLTANCFPYVLLADERLDNRIGLSNGSNQKGNYVAATGGWQQDTLAAGWTGYDFVHAGQSIRNSFTIAKSELEAGPVTIQTALLLKYTQPKAAEQPRTNRLPPNPIDTLAFAYRLPHAALDCSVVDGLERRRLEDSWGPHSDPKFDIGDATGAQLRLRAYIRDWDAIAVDAPIPDVATQSAVDLVEPGASGAPTVDWDCPQLASTPSSGIDRKTGPSQTGLPKQPWPFDGVLINELRPPMDSVVPGLVRVSDAEIILPGGAPHIGLNPTDWTPLVDAEIEYVTYQAFHVRVVEPIPTWTVVTVDARDIPVGEPAIMVLENGPGTADDRLGIAYSGNTQNQLWFARSTTAIPTGPADWLTHRVTTIGDVNRCLMEPYRGGIAIGRITPVRTLLTLSVATSQSPSSEADWSTHIVNEVEKDFEYQREFGMVTLSSGAIAFAYIDFPTDDSPPLLSFARPLVADPQEPDEYLELVLPVPTFPPFPDANPRWLSMSSIDNRPWILARNFPDIGGDPAYLYRPLLDLPLTADDFERTPFAAPDSTPLYDGYLIPLAGQVVALGYTDSVERQIIGPGVFLQLQSDPPVSPGSWSHSPNGFGGRYGFVLDNRLFDVYLGQGGDPTYVTRARLTFPPTPQDWLQDQFSVLSSDDINAPEIATAYVDRMVVVLRQDDQLKIGYSSSAW